MSRRTLALAFLLSLLGCAAPLPPATWVRLPVQADVPRVPTPGADTWQLMAPVALPGHLDRDALLLPQGSASLRALGQVRWAEPLRDAVPRLLRLDLSQALGSTVWSAPLPPGLLPTRQLRVELLALDVGADGRSVRLQARYSVADAQGRTAPRAGDIRLDVAAADSSVDALVAAHRQAVAQLATQLAAQVTAAR